ncbi:MAG: hypothetical protein JKX98_11615 [Alcanivoracaceae bacterium]|nr:hypothetical protein [Alcanivoracaceae bacterium]
MKKSKFFIFLSLLILLTLSHSVIVHQDFCTVKDYSNVKISITSGYNYEEIQKAELIGQLAKKISKKLNYSKQLFLDFDHAYTSYCEPNFIIAFDKGEVAINLGKYKSSKIFLKSNELLLDG